MVAITHDRLWIEMLRMGLLKLANFQREDYLQETLSKNYRVALENGALSLQERHTFQSPPREQAPSPECPPGNEDDQDGQDGNVHFETGNDDEATRSTYFKSARKSVNFRRDNAFGSPTSSTILLSSTTSHARQKTARVLPDGAVSIHPMLAYYPYIPRIIYDVSLPPHTLTLQVSDQPKSTEGHFQEMLEEPTTQPSMQTMRLVINEFPWSPTIQLTKHYVSVGDLLEMLYSSLRQPVLPSEYNALPTQALKDEVSIAFHSRCSRAPSKEAADEQYLKGVKRVDFLRGRTRFMGLSSTKTGPDVWVVNLA